MNHSNVSEENVKTPQKLDVSPTLHQANIAIRSIKVIYAVSCYLISMLGLVYFILFMSDLFIPSTAMSRTVDLPLELALLINFGLLLLFGLQHSVTARPKFKLWLKQYMDPSIERATYCLATGVILGFMCCTWAATSGMVWSVESPALVIAIRALGAFGWLILLIATFNIDHFELFGLRQVYSQFTGKPMPVMTFKMSGLYKWVRHPIQTGLLIGMWSVPQSSSTHFIFAMGMTIYVFVGLYFEEKDLIREFGQTYCDYIKNVGKVFPFI